MHWMAWRKKNKFRKLNINMDKELCISSLKQSWEACMVYLRNINPRLLSIYFPGDVFLFVITQCQNKISPRLELSDIRILTSSQLVKNVWPPPRNMEYKSFADPPFRIRVSRTSQQLHNSTINGIEHHLF